MVIGVTSEWSDGQVASHRGGIIKQGPLYMYLPLYVYLIANLNFLVKVNVNIMF